MLLKFTGSDSVMYVNCIGDGKQMRFHSFYLDKPASGKAKQRDDGIWEHSYVRNMSDPYFMVSYITCMCLNEGHNCNCSTCRPIAMCSAVQYPAGPI